MEPDLQNTKSGHRVTYLTFFKNMRYSLLHNNKINTLLISHKIQFLLRMEGKSSFCSHGLKYSLTEPIQRQCSCDDCGAKNIHLSQKGFIYCVPCNYDRCYNCMEKAINNTINLEEIKEQLKKKGGQTAASIYINKAVQKALGGVVPGVGAAVLMHFNAIHAAMNGDETGVISAVTSGYGAMSGAIIGTCICPGLGTAIGGFIGSALGALGGYGAGKLIKK